MIYAEDVLGGVLLETGLYSEWSSVGIQVQTQYTEKYLQALFKFALGILESFNPDGTHQSAGNSNQYIWSLPQLPQLELPSNLHMPRQRMRLDNQGSPTPACASGTVSWHQTPQLGVL